MFSVPVTQAHEVQAADGQQADDVGRARRLSRGAAAVGVDLADVERELPAGSAPGSPFFQDPLVQIENRYLRLLT
jgi:hypothetical protein